MGLDSLRKRILAVSLVVAWALGWAAAWQLFLFDLLAVDAAPGATLFVNEAGDQRSLWIGAGAALVLGSIGVFFWISSSVFRSHSLAWSRSWLVVAAVFIGLGLSAPILLPSAQGMVLDPRAEVIALERHWLYTSTSEALRFEDIDRIGLRVRRTLVGGVARGCQVATGLSIIRRDRTWMEVPNGFDHEAMANAVAEAANVRLESLGTRQC